MKKKNSQITICSIILVACFIVPAWAQDNASDLAKQTQNPIADLVSLPLQFNTYFETGPKAKTQNVLLVQPVIPFSMNEDWNFIARPIIPLMEQPPLTNTQNRNHGLGNVQFQGFFSPKEKYYMRRVVKFIKNKGFKKSLSYIRSSTISDEETF